MQQNRKYLFEERFDDDGSNSAARKSPARLAALEEGRVAGRAEAMQMIEQTTANALVAVGAAMEKLFADRETIREEMNKNAVQVALVLTRKLLPEMARRNALAEIEGLVADTLSGLLGEPRVVVRLPESMVEILRERIDGLAARNGFDGDVVLLPDPDLGPEDCHIEWADGGIEKNSDRLWQKVEQAAARLLPEIMAAAPDQAAEMSTDSEAATAPPPEANQPAAEND